MKMLNVISLLDNYCESNLVRCDNYCVLRVTRSSDVLKVLFSNKVLCYHF